MFNKEESNKKKKISIAKIDYQKVGKILLTSSLIIMLSSQSKAEIISCGESKVLYNKRVFDYKMSRNYDERIKDYYQNYQIIIDNIIYPIEKFYIFFNENITNPDFHLVNAESDYTDILNNSMDEYKYDKIVKFRDSTAFIELLNSDAIMIDDKRKLIAIIDKKKAQTIVSNWDGLIHDKVAETDAVENKDMLRR